MVNYLALIIWPPKDPEEILDYQIKWNKRLAGDVIESSTWDVPAGITAGPPAADFSDTETTIWLSGGTLDATYDLTNHIVTVAGRQMDQTARLRIKNK